MKSIQILFPRTVVIVIVIVGDIARIEFGLSQVRYDASLTISTALFGADPIFATLFDFCTDVRVTATDHFA